MSGSGSLAGKRALVFGVASEDSIAWA
ncbi:MAG: hypothetical protein QOG31_903, partial [Thermoplasmata archaeon]|nr:hypothetical protein [Thermoplasmata archaeon]